MRIPVTLQPDDNGTLLVTAPDLPEVATFGETEADALTRAYDAVMTALIGRMHNREPIPPPGSPSRHSITLPALVEVKLALYSAMLADDVGKAELARHLGWHMPQIDRLLSLNHASRVNGIEAAFRALGRELRLRVRKAA
jgi:antitoxin HicB